MKKIYKVVGIEGPKNSYRSLPIGQLFLVCLV
jgi:hypothetical protein